MKALLEALGISTVKENGHSIGCRCESCLALSDRLLAEARVRYQSHEAPQTIGDVIATELRRAKGH